MPFVRPLPLFPAVLALTTAAGTLAAQEPRDTAQLEEIIVTADREPTPLARVVQSTTVIRGEDLRARGTYFLEDALRQAPGAAVVSTGSYGGVTSLFLRGGESDYTKVLVDGVPVNQAGGSFNFGALSVDNIDRIEIVRGPASVLYGSDAVAGVVQIFTRQGAGRSRLEVAGEAGSSGTRRATVTAGGGSAEASYGVSLSRYVTDGTYRFNSRFAGTVGSGAVTLRPDEWTRLTLSARMDENDTRFPTDWSGAPVDSNQFTTAQGTTFGLDLSRRLSDRAELRAFLASATQNAGADNRPDSPGDSMGVYAAQSQNRSLRRSADLRGIFQVSPRARVTVGGQAEFEDLREYSRSEYNFGFGATVSADAPFADSRRTVGGYLQTTVDIGPGGLVNAGLRLEDNEAFGTHVTYRAGVVYGLGRGLRARGSVGSGFKEPSIRENYVRGLYEVGNPDLRPEQSRSWEVGMEQALMGGRVTAAANYFDQRFRDLIQYDPAAAPGTPTYQNVARATARGVEGHLDVRPSPVATLTASYTYLLTRVDDAGFSTGAGDVFVEGRSLIRRPSHSARLDGRVRVADRAGLGVGITYTGRRDDVDFRPWPSVRTSLPAVFLLQADAQVDLVNEAPRRPGITLSLRVENLLDESYQTVVGYPGRPRAVYAGLRAGL